ncbi:hypothetical protein [Desulfobulbus propionicus]
MGIILGNPEEVGLADLPHSLSRINGTGHLLIGHLEHHCGFR